MLDSLRSQKTNLKARFRQNYLRRLSFWASDPFRLVGAPNESLTLIIIYYLFKTHLGKQISLLESVRRQKTHLKARFRKNQLQGLSFCARWVFKCCWSSNWVPTNYINVLYVQILICDHKNFARVTSEPKYPFLGSI